MKKILLFFVMLAIAGMTFAQDVYTAGNYPNEDLGFSEAAVYKNGDLLYHSSWGFEDNSCTDVVVDQTTGDVYWIRNGKNSTLQYGDVFKNDQCYLNNPSSSSLLHALVLGDSNLYSVGYLTVDGKKTAGLWLNDEGTPYATWGDGVNDYDAKGVVYYNGHVYTCGVKTDAEGVYTGYVWKDDNTTPVVTVANTSFSDVCVYNGDIYTTGMEKTDLLELTAKIWKNGEELYILDQGMVSGGKMKIYGGDIYNTTTTIFNDRTYIWKNGQILYTIPYTGTETAFVMSDGVDATPDGLYYTVSTWTTLTAADYCDIYKDANIIQTTDQGVQVNDLFVTPAPGHDYYVLPFVEDFELGSTVWNSWTVVDVDQNNGVYASYWDLAGSCQDINTTTTNFGENYARHTHNPVGTAAQEGWLISPRILPQVGRNVTLKFQSCINWTYANDFATVWVSTSSNPTNMDDYTQVYTLPSNNSNWQEMTVDLSAFQGQPFYVAFKYQSQGGSTSPAWNIDDVSITESWTPCAAITTFPFEEHFDTDPFDNNTCWYLLDADMTDVNYMPYWQWDENESCAAHYFGSQTSMQEGWMVTPQMKLNAGMNYTLTFDNKYEYPADYSESSVWIAVDKTGTPNMADYTKIWEETNPTLEWVQQTIDLTPYAGQKVNIAFKYGGAYAHIWYVDNVVVTSALPQYTITVKANNDSYGNVTGSGTYQQGQNCTINAMAYSGYEFKKWTKNGVDVSSSANYNFQVTENATYIAVFGEPSVSYYTITTAVDPAGTGTVEGGGTVSSGSSIQLKAIPNDGYKFVKWQDGNTENPRNITVTGNATYTATFEMEVYTLTVTASPAEGGTVTGGGTYNYGDFATLTASANEGYEFLNWNDGETAANRTVKVTANAEYAAIFVDATTTTYTITAMSSNNSLGTVTGSGTYPEGTKVILTATPFGMNKFKNWHDGNTENPRIITVTGDAAFVANFSGVGVDENNETVLSLYPNPAKETIRLEGIEANTEVMFYNTLGMLVKTVSANAEQEINVSDLAAGLYMIRCGNQTLRFVKE